MKLFVPKKIREKRMETCKGCENFSQFTQRCTKCGCFMRIKTNFAASECPVKKWGKET